MAQAGYKIRDQQQVHLITWHHLFERQLKTMVSEEPGRSPSK